MWRKINLAILFSSFRTETQDFNFYFRISSEKPEIEVFNTIIQHI